MSFFDIIDSINKKKPYHWDETVQSEYNAFMINRAFSNFPDSALFAAEMNLYPDLDKRIQHDFYYYGLSKAARFAKWPKASKDSNDVALVIKAFGVNRTIAEEYVELLDKVNPSWAIALKEKMSTGGKNQ